MVMLLVPLILVIMIATLYIMYDETSNQLQLTADQIDSQNFNKSISTVVSNAEKVDTYWDTLFVFMLFTLWIIIMVISFLLGNNPIFLLFYGMSSFGLLFLAVTMQFALETFIGSNGLEFIATNFPKMNFIINNFFIFSIVFIIGIGIALYLKPRGRALLQ